MNGGLPSAGPVKPAGAIDGSAPTIAGAPLVQSSANAMTGQPLQRQVTITNPMGFHFRPVAAFAKLAASFQCSVMVVKEDRRVNGKSPLELMLLAAEQGTVLTVEAVGDDAGAALEALAELLANTNWDEAPEDRPLPPKG